MRGPSVSRRVLLPLAGLLALLFIAAPVFALAKPVKPDKGPELAKTLAGTVASSEDAKAERHSR